MNTKSCKLAIRMRVNPGQRMNPNSHTVKPGKPEL